MDITEVRVPLQEQLAEVDDGVVFLSGQVLSVDAQGADNDVVEVKAKCLRVQGKYRGHKGSDEIRPVRISASGCGPLLMALCGTVPVP